MRVTKVKAATHKGMVKLMREIRDNLNLEVMDMTYEQERAYIDKLLAAAPKK